MSVSPVPMLVDVHCHLDMPQFKDDLDEVIERARATGVIKIICAGLNPSSNRAVLELARKYSLVAPALGLYPEDAIKMNKTELENELNFIESSIKSVKSSNSDNSNHSDNIVALSEIGLDFAKPELKEKSELQQRVFNELLEIASKYSLPVIVHSRKAEEKVIELIAKANANNSKNSRSKIKAVLHCFTGKISLAKEAEKIGCYFSIPAIVKNSTHFTALVETIPSTKLLTETDAPFLSPIKGKRNEPSAVAESIKRMAMIKKITAEEMQQIVFMNYKSLFAR